MGTIVYCPECGKAVSEKAKFCRYCGMRIPAVQEEKTFCPQCGRQCEPGERFCEDCGAELTSDTPATPGTTGFESFVASGTDGIGSIQWDISGEQLEAQQESYNAQRMENFEYTRNPDGTYIVTRFKGMYDDSVIVPDCVKAIAEGAFEGARLIEVTLPETLTFIGAGAFRNCRYLEKINIPSSVSVIEDEAFAWCENLDIAIPVTVRNQGKNFLLGTKSDRLAKEKAAHETKEQETEREAREEAARQAQEEAERKVREEATRKAKEEAEYRMRKEILSRLCWVIIQVKEDMRESLEKSDCKVTADIGREECKKWHDLFEYDEKHYVKLINKATEGHVYIPDDAMGIADNAFQECKGITGITMPNSITSIGYGAFDGCENLTSITIPEGVTSIGDGAFTYCKRLKSVMIPSSVTCIGYCESLIFADCDNLTNITVGERNNVYHSASNCLIKTSSKTLIAGCKASVIPSDGSVTSIGDFAFSYCLNLSSITIPSSVTSIGYRAFSNCQSLTSVTIPDSVTNIEGMAFSKCNHLTSITIPGSITSIATDAFNCCLDLTNIHYGGTKVQWRALHVDKPNSSTIIYCKDGTL